MAMAKKGRRTLTVDGRTYYWKRTPRNPGHPQFPDSPAVTILSEDGGFHVRYHLFQRSDTRYLTVLGPELIGDDATGERRYRCPEFGFVWSPVVVPSTIREIIDWCHGRARRIPVDAHGQELAAEPGGSRPGGSYGR